MEASTPVKPLDQAASGATVRAGALPNLIVIGAQKCGTSVLHYYLSLHPEVSMSKPTKLSSFGWGCKERKARVAKAGKKKTVAKAGKKKPAAAAEKPEAVTVDVSPESTGSAPATVQLRGTMPPPAAAAFAPD